MRPLHNTPSAASLSRFGLGHVRKHTPFALTLSSLHLWHSAKSLPKKRCFFGERPFCKGLEIGKGCGVLEKYTHRGAEMNNKKEAKKSGETSRKSQKTGLKQRSYDDKFKLKVMREMVCTGETLASLSKRHDVPITTISRWISTFGVTTPKQIREQVMSKNISDIERKLIEKERECEELKVRLREAQIECEIKKASLDYLSSKYHIDLKKKNDLD